MFSRLNVVVFAAIVVIFTSLTTFSQEVKKQNFHSTVEVEASVSPAGKVSEQVKAFLTYSLTKKWGLYGWAQTSKGYSQAYGGVTYSPKSFVQIGVATGVEQAHRSYRVAGFVWAGKNKFSNLLVLENGGSGFWYRNKASYQVTKNVSASFVTQRFAGSGVRGEFKIRKGLKIGTEVLINSAGPTFVTGVIWDH